MERWNSAQSKNIENPKIDVFLLEIAEVCKKHNLSISHEDQHGNFRIENFDQSTMDWLLSAPDDTETK